MLQNVSRRWRDDHCDPPSFYSNTDLLPVVLPVEGTLLLALLAGVRGPVLLLRVCAPLALVSNKRRDDVAVLAGFGL